MHAFESIAEQRISEAVAKGELDNLPGAGKPLDLNDDPLVPEDLRMAYHILKNSGYVPPEVEAFKAVADLERLVHSLDEGEARSQAMKKLRLLSLQSGEMRNSSLQVEADYYGKLLERLT